MRIARPTVSVLLAAGLLAFSGTASAREVRTSGSVAITQRAGVSVLQDVVTQTNITVTVIGTAGDAVGVAVPGSVNMTSVAGESLQLVTSSPQLMYASGVILTQDTVSVNIAAIIGPEVIEPQPGRYDGVLRVIAQYN